MVEPSGMSEAPSSGASEGEGAVSAGRGVLYIGIAKLWFIVAGLMVEVVLLPRLLGRFLFGAYGFVNGAVSIVNSVIDAGTVQAVSRYTTERLDHAAALRGAGFRMHLFVGTPVALAFVVAAPLVAYLAHDPSKTVPLILAA